MWWSSPRDWERFQEGTLPQSNIAAPRCRWLQQIGRTSVDELKPHALPRTGGGGRQPRADQVPSEQSLMDPKDPINQENGRSTG